MKNIDRYILEFILKSKSLWNWPLWRLS